MFKNLNFFSTIFLYTTKWIYLKKFHLTKFQLFQFIDTSDGNTTKHWKAFCDIQLGNYLTALKEYQSLEEDRNSDDMVTKNTAIAMYNLGR